VSKNWEDIKSGVYLTQPFPLVPTPQNPPPPPSTCPAAPRTQRWRRRSSGASAAGSREDPYGMRPSAAPTATVHRSRGPFLCSVRPALVGFGWYLHRIGRSTRVFLQELRSNCKHEGHSKPFKIHSI